MAHAKTLMMKARTAPGFLAFFAFSLGFLCLVSSCAAGKGDVVESEIRIVSPTGSTSVQDTITFEIETTGRFVGDVTLSAGDMVVHTWEPRGTILLTVDTTSMPDDFYVFTAQGLAPDETSVTASVTLTVDNNGPMLELVEPRVTDVYLEDGEFPFVVYAEDISGIDRVVLYIDEVPLEEWVSPINTNLSVNFDPTSLGAETTEVFVRVEAFDREGRSTETGRRLNILRRELFTSFIDAAEYGPVLLLDQTVVVGTNDRLSVIEADGTPRCSMMTTAPTSAPLLALPEANVVYWSTLDALHVVSLLDCVAVSTLPTLVVTGMARQSDTVATVTFSGLLRIHTAATGAIVREVDLSTLVTGTLEMIHNGVTFAPDGTLFLAGTVGTTSGALFVQEPLGEVVFHPVAEAVEGGIAADEGGVFLPGREGNLYRYDTAGSALWRRPAELSLGRAIESTPIIGRDDEGRAIVVVADGRTTVHALDVETGESVWTHDVTVTSLTAISRAGVGSGGVRRYYAVGDALGGVTVLERDGSLRFRSFVSLGGDSTAVKGTPAVGSERVVVIDEFGLLVVYSL